MKINNITVKSLQEEIKSLRAIVDNIDNPYKIENNNLKREVSINMSKVDEFKLKAITATSKFENLKKDYHFIKSQYTFLEIENNKIMSQNEKLNQDLNNLQSDNLLLKEEIKKQKIEISRLNALISKDLDNSSIPSSQSFKKKVFNNRVKTTKLKGGQPGHKGHSLKYFEPTEIIVLDQPKNCSVCDTLLVYKSQTIRKQIADLKFELKVIEYQAKVGECPNCGYIEKPFFPSHIVNNVHYGNKLKAFATLLTSYGFISINRTASIIKEITDGKVTLSWGTLFNLSNEFSKKAKGSKEIIIKQLLKELFLHVDETTIRAEKKRAYIFVAASLKYVYYFAHASRGKVALMSSFINEYSGTLVHDHYTAYYNYGSNHQECNVHILRYLKAVIENEKKKWASEMISLLLDSSHLRKDYMLEGKACFEESKIKEIESKYDTILKQALDEYSSNEDSFTSEGKKLQRRLVNYKKYHLLYINNFNIPFDNNLAERMIRPIKTKVKVSGAFGKADKGASYFTDFRSIIATAQLQKKNVFDTVERIFNSEVVFEVSK